MAPTVTLASLRACFPIYSVDVGTYAGGHQGALRAHPRCSSHERAQVWGVAGRSLLPKDHQSGGTARGTADTPSSVGSTFPSPRLPLGDLCSSPTPTPSGLSQPCSCGCHPGPQGRVLTCGWGSRAMLPHPCRDPLPGLCPHVGTGEGSTGGSRSQVRRVAHSRESTSEACKQACPESRHGQARAVAER